MRTFKLYTSDKSSYMDLNDKKYFTTNWQGLGLAFDLSTVDTIDSFYVDNIKSAKTNITATVNFIGNAYGNYNTFNDFIQANKGTRQAPNVFILEYNDGIRTVDRDVYFVSLDKTEKTIYNHLECKITLTPVKGWYQDVIQNQSPVLSTTTNFLTSFNDQTLDSDALVYLEMNYFGIYFIPRIQIQNQSDYINGTYSQIILQNFDVNNFNNGYNGIYPSLVIDSINKKFQMVHRGYTPPRITNIYGNVDKTQSTFIYVPAPYDPTYNIKFKISIYNDYPSTVYSGTVNVTMKYRRYI